MEPRQTGKRGRPRRDPELAISHGIVVQPRFPRSLHCQVKAAAAAEGLTISRWILELSARAAGAQIQAASRHERRKKTAWGIAFCAQTLRGRKRFLG